MTPEQTRAARAWLNWSQEELANRANVSVSTLKDFERGKRVPIKNNVDAIRAALEGAGLSMVFGEDGKAAGIGVRDADAPT